jgi:hypothetical protein
LIPYPQNEIALSLKGVIKLLNVVLDRLQLADETKWVPVRLDQLPDGASVRPRRAVELSSAPHTHSKQLGDGCANHSSGAQDASPPIIKCVGRKSTHSKLEKAPETKSASGVVCAAVFVHCHRTVHFKSASRARGIPETMTPKHGCNVIGH